MTIFDRVPVFAIICVLVAMFLGYGAWILPQPGAFQQISASIWPLCLAATLLAVGIAIVFENAAAGEPAAIEEDDDYPDGPAGWIYLAGIALAAAGVVYLGFIVTCALLIGLVALLKAKREKWLRSTITAIVLPIAIYLIFTRVFSQYLPYGLLFDPYF